MRKNTHSQKHNDIISLLVDYDLDVDDDFFQQIISSLTKENGKYFV